MTAEEHAAFHEMLGALKQATKRADQRLKAYFRDRSDECDQDYERCINAIAQAEAAIAAKTEA